MSSLLRRLPAMLVLLAASAIAQDDAIGDRVRKLEDALRAERARGDKRDERIRELEEALRKTTDALAQSQDTRRIEVEIENYLAQNLPADAPAGSSRLSIGGVIVASYRGTAFSGGGANTNTFQVEERYVRFVYRFSDDVTARYYTNGSVAEIEYHHSDLAQINFGVVVVPFGQFNQRSFPDTFDTLSRPLLYLGDEDVFANPANNPKPVFRSIYSDTGIVLSGNHYGEKNSVFDQVYYALFVTNGLVGVGDLGGDAAFSDNNDGKQFGVRITVTNSTWINGARVGLGFSWMGGEYDRNDTLSYRMTGADLVVVFDGIFRGGEGSLTVRTEFVYAPREIQAGTLGDPTSLIVDANRTYGAYVIVEARLDRRWMVYAQFDWLSQHAPLLNGGLIDPANTQSATSQILRYAAGIVHKFEIGIVWKLEYAYWSFSQGAPDAHRFSTQVVVPF